MGIPTDDYTTLSQNQIGCSALQIAASWLVDVEKWWEGNYEQLHLFTYSFIVIANLCSLWVFGTWNIHQCSQSILFSKQTKFLMLLQKTLMNDTKLHFVINYSHALYLHIKSLRSRYYVVSSKFGPLSIIQDLSLILFLVLWDTFLHMHQTFWIVVDN